MRELPLGVEVPDFTPPPRPDGLQLDGRYCRIEPLSGDHIAPLWAAFEGAPDVWAYLPAGPFEDFASFERFMTPLIASTDPVFYAIWDKDGGCWSGFASFLRIAPEAGSVEVGYITMSPALQRTRAATEAMFLMMQWAFEAGYRRYEWKCNALNRPSRRAGQRLGLSFEGVFRQAQIVKGRNRDTAWFAAIDTEWPELRGAYDAWLSEDNFDREGRQKSSLGRWTAPVLFLRDPMLEDA